MLQTPSNTPPTAAQDSAGEATGAAAATGPVAPMLSSFSGNPAKQPADVPRYQFTGAAISDDGLTIVVTPAINRIFVSRDGGATFAATFATPVNNAFSGVAISSSGQYMSVIIFGGVIHRSSDYGATWTSTSVPSALWLSVASDNSGQKLAATSYQLGSFSNSTMLISTDGGVSWQESAVGALQGSKSSFISVASNGDGSRLLATAALVSDSSSDIGEGAIYFSDDSGGSWFRTDAVPSGVVWLSVAAAEKY